MLTLHLAGQDIDGDDISCSGRQIAEVLELLLGLKSLADCVWYAGSIDCFGASIEPFRDRVLKIVANPWRLSAILRTKTQLRDGVFVAVPRADPPRMLAGAVTAYGSEDRIVSNSRLEMRAFDTTSLEIYTDDPRIADQLRGRFRSEQPGGADRGY